RRGHQLEEPHHHRCHRCHRLHQFHLHQDQGRSQDQHRLLRVRDHRHMEYHHKDIRIRIRVQVEQQIAEKQWCFHLTSVQQQRSDNCFHSNLKHQLDHPKDLIHSKLVEKQWCFLERVEQ